MIKALIDNNYNNETKHVEQHNSIVQEGNPSTIDISYSMVVAVLVMHSQAKKYLQINPKPFKQVVMKFPI